MWKGKEKYYQIRKELVWGAGLLIACLLLMLLQGMIREMPTIRDEQAKVNLSTERKELPKVQSELADKGECYLCGSADESLMKYFRNFDDLGVICVNQWYVLDMGILPHEGKEEDSGGTRTSATGTGEDGDYFFCSQTPSRGISSVEVRYGENSILDVDQVRKILCQTCLDKLLSVMGTYGPVGEEPQPRDLCLVDFQTLELYSLQEQYVSYYIRDYYVRLDQTEDGMEIEAVYAPERE